MFERWLYLLQNQTASQEWILVDQWGSGVIVKDVIGVNLAIEHGAEGRGLTTGESVVISAWGWLMWGLEWRYESSLSL